MLLFDISMNCRDIDSIHLSWFAINMNTTHCSGGRWCLTNKYGSSDIPFKHNFLFFFLKVTVFLVLVLNQAHITSAIIYNHSPFFEPLTQIIMRAEGSAPTDEAENADTKIISCVSSQVWKCALSYSECKKQLCAVATQRKRLELINQTLPLW